MICSTCSCTHGQYYLIMYTRSVASGHGDAISSTWSSVQPVALRHVPIVSHTCSMCKYCWLGVWLVRWQCAKSKKSSVQSTHTAGPSQHPRPLSRPSKHSHSLQDHSQPHLSHRLKPTTQLMSVSTSTLAVF